MSSSMTAASCFVSLIIAVEVNEAATAPVIIEKKKVKNFCSRLKSNKPICLYVYNIILAYFINLD